MPFSFIPKLVQYAALFVIRLYQRTLSPDTGISRLWYPYGCCRFTPTCSQYAIDAIIRYGTFRGCLLAARRIGRCHPWHGCEHDPVPTTHS